MHTSRSICFFLCALSVLVFASCSGYQLGGSKPAHLAHISKIHVPLFKNDTLLIRAESYATNSAVDAIVRDGTYLIANAASADAVLYGKVSEVKYKQVSSSRRDSLRSEELGMDVGIEWKLYDSKNLNKLLAQGKAVGSTRFFAGGNLRTARTNAMPDALRRASENMVSRIADGF